MLTGDFWHRCWYQRKSVTVFRVGALWPLAHGAARLLYVSLYQCTDSLWRYHAPAPLTGMASSCWALGGIESGDAPSEICNVGGDAEGGSGEACSSCATDSPSAEVVTEGKRRKGWAGSAQADAETLLGNTVLLSISGGNQDTLVHPSLCETESLGLEGQSVALTTAVIGGCGFEVDHQALVWCLQLSDR